MWTLTRWPDSPAAELEGRVEVRRREYMARVVPGRLSGAGLAAMRAAVQDFVAGWSDAQRGQVADMEVTVTADRVVVPVPGGAVDAVAPALASVLSVAGNVEPIPGF